VPGHANFSKAFADLASALTAAQVKGVAAQIAEPVGSAHVNSGPTKHSNVPGHANFSKTFRNAGVLLDRNQLKALKDRLA
jgi:hypothetical protein